LFVPGKSELQWYIGNSALAAMLIGLVASAMLSTYKRPSMRKSAVLGFLAGALWLTHAGPMLFVAFAAVVAVIAAREDALGRRWMHGAVVLAIATAVVLPWTYRNYTAFGTVVPVRTGLGQNMAYALPALAQTIRPDIDLGIPWSPPPWTARDAPDAVAKVLDLERWIQLNRHALAAGKAGGPVDYGMLNEAQRDRVLRDQSFDFIRSYPGLALRLGVAKAHGFFWSNWPAFRVVTILALLGALLATRRRGGWIIVGLVVLYAVPYVVSAPLYYRYRASIEPLMFVLCGLVAGWCVDLLRSRRTGRGRAVDPVLASPAD
jgi:hypothetical protein